MFVIEINPKRDAYAIELGIVRTTKILFRRYIHQYPFWARGVKAAFKKSLSFRSYSIMDGWLPIFANQTTIFGNCVGSRPLEFVNINAV